MMEPIDIIIIIAISGAVGITILLFQRRLERKVDQLVEDQHKIIEEEHKRQEEWKTTWSKRITDDLGLIKQYHLILRMWLVDYINNRSDVGRETLTYSAERLGDITEFHVQNLRENIP